MNEIIDIIRGYSVKDSIDALYYAIRFIKQADSISKNDKDFFEDDERSMPSQEARKLTIRIIDIIEAKYGKNAAELDDAEFIEAMKALSAARNTLETPASAAEEEAAREAINSMVIPELKGN
jgi:hypothetical protein